MPQNGLPGKPGLGFLLFGAGHGASIEPLVSL